MDGIFANHLACGRFKVDVAQDQRAEHLLGLDCLEHSMCRNFGVGSLVGIPASGR